MILTVNDLRGASRGTWFKHLTHFRQTILMDQVLSRKSIEIWVNPKYIKHPLELWCKFINNYTTSN